MTALRIFTLRDPAIRERAAAYIRGEAPAGALTEIEAFVCAVHPAAARRLVRVHDRRVGEVSGTVASHSDPMTTEKISTDSGVIGSMMNSAEAMARPV